MTNASFRRYLWKFIEVLVRAETIFIMIILGVMGIINVLEIFFRTFFAMSLMWVLPLTLLLFSWLTFIGAAVVFYHKEYIVVDYFLNSCFSKYKGSLLLVGHFGVMLFVLFILYEMPGLLIAQKYKMEILHFPAYVLSLPVLIGLTTILLLMVHRTWDIFEKP
jgi:TRAP-type C4-dicarboxylate transport system permease small subunit